MAITSPRVRSLLIGTEALAGVQGICSLNAGRAGHIEQYAKAEIHLRTAANHGPKYQRNNNHGLAAYTNVRTATSFRDRFSDLRRRTATGGSVR